MIVIVNGKKKDLHYTIANKMLKRGIASLIEEKVEEPKQPKTRKKVVND